MQNTIISFLGRFSVGVSLVGLIGCLLSPGAAAEDALEVNRDAAAAAKGRVDFNRDVRPIFSQHCTSCHGGVSQAADLSFVYRDQVLPPDGWIVEPGEPDASELISRVVSTDPDLVMPPPEHGAPLNETQVDLLRRWIEQGADWQDHWAYQRLTQPVHDAAPEDPWCREPMDALVLKSIRQRGLQTSPAESPSRWLRRVSLGLVGLPPTPADLKTFEAELQEDGETAYASAVDRLLQSPRYGEHWASIWLDQVRYADSKGLGLDAPRKAWKYRDWVIKAFNDDMKFDEFTRKQIAGDLMPDGTLEDRIATAAHRLTQTNEEGGTDDEEFRVEAVIDRVSTVWQAWQGVTFGCAQCHDHPYAPLKHDEFYRFAAFFNNTADCDLGEEYPILSVPKDPAQYENAGRLDRSITELRHEIWNAQQAAVSEHAQWAKAATTKASTNNDTVVVVERSDEWSEYRTRGTVSKGTEITVELAVPEGISQLTALRLTVLPLDLEKAKRDSEWGFVLSSLKAELIIEGQSKPTPVTFSSVLADEPEPFLNPNDSLNPKSSNGFAAYTRIHFPRSAVFVGDKPFPCPPGSRLRVILGHRRDALGAFPLVSKRARFEVSGQEELLNRLADESIVSRHKRLSGFQSERRRIASIPLPVLRERPEHLKRPTHVFHRGAFLDKAEEVSAGTPAFLPDVENREAPSRLDLANWLVSPENPLTARVAVNRMWARLFGTGLVLTEEDMGSSGEPASHPELLDHLAWRFQFHHDWSMKAILREIVLSSTYRQSSKMDADSVEKDPQNRWLARGPRFRLPAEVVRDQALAVSGLLAQQIGGPPVFPPIPGGVWKPFFGGDKWSTAPATDPNRYRRSIYTYRKRSIPYPMFATFDSPSREFCAPRRLRSNTPLQALTLLNEETYLEAAKALAKRMGDLETDPQTRLAQGFQWVTGRPAKDSELDVLEKLESDLQDRESNERLEVIAGLLLNLDEIMTN